MTRIVLAALLLGACGSGSSEPRTPPPPEVRHDAAVAVAAGAAPVPAMLGATLGSSFGFMLPISTAPNAMAYGTGRVRVVEMARAGVVFDLVGFVLIVVGLRVLCPLLGMTKPL
jgi:sodium-dependent dicarboxylate transporter 2/3/5